MLTAPSPQLHLKQAQLEAVSKERGALLDEVHRLREESAEARHTIKRLQQQQAAAAASAAAVAAQQTQAQQAAGRQGEVADIKQQEPAGVEQEQQGAAEAGAQDAAAEQGAEQERQRWRQEHAAEVARLEAELSLAHRQNAELQQQLAHAQAQPGAAAGAMAAGGQQQLGASPAASAAATPTAAAAAAGPAISAFISQSALREAAQHDQQPAGAQQGQQAGSLPPELAALLPAALYSLPAGGPSDVASGEAALQLTTSIYLLLDALEEDKRQMVAALNAKQVGGIGDGVLGRWQAMGPQPTVRLTSWQARRGLHVWSETNQPCLAAALLFVGGGGARAAGTASAGAEACGAAAAAGAGAAAAAGKWQRWRQQRWLISAASVGA